MDNNNNMFEPDEVLFLAHTFIQMVEQGRSPGVIFDELDDEMKIAVFEKLQELKEDYEATCA